MKLIGVTYCTRKRHFSQALAGNSHQAPGTVQLMCANQFALRDFNGIAPPGFELERDRALFLPPGLQRGVILTDQDHAVLLLLAQTPASQGAVMTAD